MADSETQFYCSHPRIRGPKREETVLRLTCMECEFSQWSPEMAKANYFRRRVASPTTEQYAFRIAFCDQCEFRRENYCPKAGGACGLLSSLAKSSFECPEEFFGQINNVPTEETPVAAQPVADRPAEATEAQEAEAGDGDGAHVAAEPPASQ
jgi:hypothetical protein